VFKSFVSNSHSLYKFLIAPFAPFDKGTKRIIFVPDGALGQVPFETLIGSKPPGINVDYLSLNYLLKKYTTGYAYASASLFNSGDGVISDPSILAMASSGEQVVDDIDFHVIPGTEDELRIVEGKLTTGQFLFGDDATEFNFKKLSPVCNIIHLAVHGKGDLLKNNASSLYFSNVNDSLEDGQLHAYELYGLKLKARLVVLSACETGLGKTYKGEGMMSMASAFAFSGCQNILMSLWKVNDNMSTDLINDFYDALLKGISIDEAIAQAKRRYISQADELSADPRVWAPLVSYGNLEPVFATNKNRTHLVIFLSAIGVLFLLCFVVYRFKKRSTGPSRGRHVAISKR
jgi:CHAT domain-containing protein